MKRIEYIVSRENYVRSPRADFTCPGVNDGALIQQALDELKVNSGGSGGILTILPGVYDCPNDIVIPEMNDLTIRGEEGTILSFSDKKRMKRTGTTSLGGLVIEGLTLKGTADRNFSTVVPQNELLRLETVDGFRLSNLNISGSWMSGLGLVWPGQGEVISCHTNSNKQNGIVIWTDGTNPHNAIGVTFLGCVADYNGFDGINITCPNTVMVGCRATRSGKDTTNDAVNGFHIAGGEQPGIIFDGCVAEDNTLNGFETDRGAGSPSKPIIFKGCRASRNGGGLTYSDYAGFMLNVSRSILIGCVAEGGPDQDFGICLRAQNIPTGNDCKYCQVVGCIVEGHNQAGQYGIVEYWASTAVSVPNDHIISNVTLLDNTTQIVAGSQYLDATRVVKTKVGNTTIVGNKIEG